MTLSYVLHKFMSSYVISYYVFTGAYGNSLITDLDRWLNSVSKTIDFMEKRPNQINIDAVLGIVITEAHINATLMHKNANLLNLKHLNMLNNIRNTCQRIRLSILSVIEPDNEDLAYLNKKISNPELWMFPILWKKGALDPAYPKNLILSAEEIKKLLYQGTPREIESDECLISIFKNQVGYICPIVERCRKMLVRNDDSNGYPLTHRLFFILVTIGLKCQTQFGNNLYKLVPQYCSKILQNLVDIEAAGFPYNSPDMAIEQVLLCGMAGYLDFLTDHYGNLIESMQFPQGCFRNSVRKYNSHVTKRSSVKMDFGCDSHTTGLGGGSIALFIRKKVENMFS